MSSVTLALVGLASSGCAVGIGIVEPGTKRTSHQQVSDVTYNGTAQVGYTKISSYTVDNIRDVDQAAGNGFWGTLIGVHGGANAASVGDHGGSGWVAETFWEVLGGRGRWAFGVRLGLMLRKSDDVDVDGDGDGDVATAYGGFPVTVHGYYGLSSSLYTHVGIGGDAFTFGDNPRSLRVMSGLRFALSSNDNGATLLLLDVDHLRSTRDDGAYRSFGLIGGFAFVR